MSLQQPAVRARVAAAMIGFWAVLAGAFLGLATVKVLYPTENPGLLRTMLGFGFALVFLAVTSVAWHGARPPGVALMSLAMSGYGLFTLLVILVRWFHADIQPGPGMLALTMGAVLLVVIGVMGTQVSWQQAKHSRHGDRAS